MRKYLPKIVVIDSGYSSLPNEPLLVNRGCTLSKMGDAYMMLPIFEDSCGHGSGVVKIIKRENPNSEIFMVKILDYKCQCDVELLIYALKWIYYNLECDMVNMSFGVANLNKTQEDEIRYILQLFNKKGTVIVAAHMNEGGLAFPACLSEVLGVDSTTELPSSNSYIYSESDYVNVIGKSGLYKGQWGLKSHELVAGTSYVTALLTGKMSLYITKPFIGLEVMKEKLRDNARYVDKIEKNYAEINDTLKYTHNAKRIIVFPFNKETTGLVEFFHLTPFRDIRIVDTRYGCAGRKVRQVISHYNGKYADAIIENIDDITLDGVDLFVLGHLESLMATTGIDYLDKVLRLCNESCIPVYSFSEIKNNGYIGVKIFTPKITKHDIPLGRYNKLWVIGKPVLAIMGTGSKQGKNTLQLKLRELFLQNGYNVAQLGTEPSALLYQFDCVFPMGYMSTVEVNNNDAVIILNEMMHHMDQSDSDLIIVGGQSGCITLLPWNLQYYNVPQSDFLAGTAPDAVIVCINAHDEIEVIERTVKFIESINPSKVIAFVLYPIERKSLFGGNIIRSQKVSETTVQEVRNQLQERYPNTGVFALENNDDMVCLLGTVIDYFAESEETH